MLKRIETKIGEIGGFFMTEDAEDGTLIVKFIGRENGQRLFISIMLSNPPISAWLSARSREKAQWSCNTSHRSYRSASKPRSGDLSTAITRRSPATVPILRPAHPTPPASRESPAAGSDPPESTTRDWLSPNSKASFRRRPRGNLYHSAEHPVLSGDATFRQRHGKPAIRAIVRRSDQSLTGQGQHTIMHRFLGVHIQERRRPLLARMHHFEIFRPPRSSRDAPSRIMSSPACLNHCVMVRSACSISPTIPNIGVG